MKKLFLILLVFSIVFSIASCGTKPNGNGSDTPSGSDKNDDFDTNKVTFTSAYQKAQSLGFEGTLDEFIELISGEDGEHGKDGEDGVGIVTVIIDDGGNLLVVLSNGNTVNCGKVKGADGKDGVDGAPGKDGLTPTVEISADGYWIINGVKTEYKAVGTNGANGTDGKDGEDGKDGFTPTIEISADGYWIINGIKTEHKAIGTDGQNGAPGKDGEDGEAGNNGTDGVTPTIKLEGGELWVSYDGGATWKLLGNVNDKVCHHRDINDDYSCDYCSNPYSDGIDVPTDPDHTHNFGAWKYFSVNFSYCDEALYYRLCSGCNVIDWRDGTEEDHSYTITTTAPTCTALGYDTKTCSKCGRTVKLNETPIIAHTYNDNYSFDASYHWKECIYCGNIKDKDEHTVDDSNICILCEEPLGPTAGIIYDVSIDGTYAEVLGYEGTATKIVIADTYKDLPVKNIFADVFQGNTKIVSIVIPDSVTSINNSAFSGCNNLTNVVIGNGVAEIGDSAFLCCYKLTSITIPDSVTRIGSGAFSSCSNLASIIIPNGVTSIDSGAFSRCFMLRSITISDSVVSIGSGAFDSCSNITSITIPDSVTSIGNSAFSGCSKLSSVTISDGVFIGESAFSGCNSSLYTEYEYGKYIGDESNPYAVLYGLTNKNFTTYNIHRDTKVIAYGVFIGCSRLTNIEIPVGVKTICDGAFSGCSNLNGVYITDMTAWCNINFCAYVGPGDPTSNPLYYAKNLYLNGELVTSLVIPDDVTEIGKSAFYNCTSLKSVSFDAKVTKINDMAFYGCTGLKSIYIPLSVTAIGAKAFYNCTNLESASVSSSVISVGEAAFDNCHSSLYTMYEGGKYVGTATNPHAILLSASSVIHSNTRIIADYACSKIYASSITIPYGVTHIGKYAFGYCYNTTSIIIPNSVISIGDNAFYECYDLSSITIGKGVTSIGDNAFYYCYNLNNVKINDIKAWCGISFGEGASNPLHTAKNLYLNDDLVTELVIPKGTTSISDGAFAYCTSITSVIIPDTVEKIGDMAFYGCVIKSAEIPTLAIDHIDKRALEYVTITAGERIESGAFKNCAQLKSLMISDCVTSIGDDAFLGCHIKIAKLPAFAFAYISKDELQIVEIKSGDIESGAFKGCQHLKGVTISDGVKIIGDEAFAYCPALTYVTIPSNIEKVGDKAFAYCEKLANAMIVSGVSELASNVFEGCTSLIAVYYYGSTDEWAKITIVGDEAILDSLPIYLYSYSEPAEDGNFWHYVNGTPTVWEQNSNSL